MKNIYAARLWVQGTLNSPPALDPIQTLTGNDLIALPTFNVNKRLTMAGNITGVTMPVGSKNLDGQEIHLINLSAYSVTFAASASNVSTGSSISISAGRKLILMWDNTSGLWYA